ncbi:MAG TPA: MFS transporter [Propionibacteriaceae bacterium]|nr:MFS transporter [Propionibacteriaceae bacterium]
MRTSLPRPVIVLGIIAFCVAVGFGVLVPVLPVFARSFEVGYLEVGAVVSVFALMRLVASPFCGPMIVRAGERAVLATGIFIVAISSGLAGISQTYGQLLVLRGVGGVGSAMFTVSAMTLLLASVSSDIRGRAAGFYQGGFLIGSMAGPAVGGLLSAISLTAPFFFYAATLAVAGTVGLALLEPSRTGATGTHEAPPVPFRSVLRDARFQAACAANLAQGWTSMGVRSALVPVLVVEVLHRTAAWTGIAFACAAVAQTVAVGPAGRFVDTVGRRPAMVGGGVLGALSIAVVPFAPDIWTLMGALCLYGVAAAFLGTAPAAAVGDAAGGRNGTAVAVFSMCSDVGSIVGPLVAGLLVDRVGYPVAIGVGAALILAAAVNALRMPGGIPVPVAAPAVERNSTSGSR